MAAANQHEPVAIVGMGCRWPGGVSNSPELWDFLMERYDGLQEFDKPRYSAEGFYHPNTDRPGTMAMRSAFLTEGDARLFDYTFFGMTALEVETLDPGQRKLLEVAYEAIENAGESWESISGTRTGVFVGNFSVDHWMIQQRDWDNPRPYAFSGAGTSILANRISYVFNLKGPSLTVDTAFNAIRAGDCDSAIVASSNWIGDPGVQMALDKMGALSATSRCHTFDSRADGYARGEGFCALYLKRISSAVADESPIRAVIRGTAINANGRTGGISRPSVAGQEAVIREAYRNAGGLPYSDTSYFECHGTGTSVGDPLEVAAVGRVFASEKPHGEPMLVGSVKTNVGHSEGASALASIMKVVLSLENGIIPPIFDIETPNPAIDFEGANVKIVTDATSWPNGKLRRASINSFGYGGSNGHCILDHVHSVIPDYVKPGVRPGQANGNSSNGITSEESRSTNANAANHTITIKVTGAATAATRQLVLLPFSAHNEASLQMNIEALSKTIDRFSLADVAYTLGDKRSKLSHRSFRIVDKSSAAQGLLHDGKVWRSPAQSSKLAFIFTGQGAQWHAMGASLFEYRVFRTTIKRLDHVLEALQTPPSWTLADTAEVSQTVCTAAQIGLVDLLASWSVRPSSVAGHSSGEMAAAYASGYITAAEAIVAAYFRGQAVSRNKENGAMLAVGLGPDEVSFKYLGDWGRQVNVAAINSQDSVTISGDAEAIKKISEAPTADGVFNRVLKTGGNAYHSHHMNIIGCDYDQVLSNGLKHIENRGLVNRQQCYDRVPWISSVAPGKIPPYLTAVEWSSYWRTNLESPVRFYEAVSILLSLEGSKQVHAFLEVGPHPALKSPLAQIAQGHGKSISYVSTLKRQEDGRVSMLQLAGQLFCLNYPEINLAAVNSVDDLHSKGMQRGCTAIDLPQYQYAYGPVIYHESRQSKEYRFRTVPRHDLLGSKVVGNAKLRPQWRNILRLKDLAWLSDYSLLSDTVLPSAGYITMAVEAVSQVYSSFPGPVKITGYTLSNVRIKASMKIPQDDYGLEVLTSMETAGATDATSPEWATFSISSVNRDTEEWTEHCTGLIKVEVSEATVYTDKIDMADAVLQAANTSAWYRKLSALGLNYGKSFQSVSKVMVDQDLNLAVGQLDLIAAADNAKGYESSYPLHPTAFEGAFQLGFLTCRGGQIEQTGSAFAAVQIPQIYLKNGICEESNTVVGYAKRHGLRGSDCVDLQLLSQSGKIVMSVENLRFASFISAQPSSTDGVVGGSLARLVWKPSFRYMNNRQSRNMFPPPQENVEIAPLWGTTNRLAHMVVYDIYRKYAQGRDGPKPSGEVGHFLAWIKRMGEKDQSEPIREARGLSNDELLQRINQLIHQAPNVTEVKIIKLLHEEMADILYERKTGIDILIQNDLLTPLYQTGLLMTSVYPQLSRVLEGLGHSNPNLRILEIGGGTGGATRIAVKALSGPNGTKNYHDYTFTDVSPGFLSSARDSMTDFQDFNYAVLDVEVDPVKQGFEPVYDLIIASQVLHATISMANTLANVRKMLKPGGQLLLVESNRNFTVHGIVVGTFTGYWFGIPDGRVDAPFMGLERWDSELRKAGFSGLDIVLDDFPSPHNTTSAMLSTLLRPSESTHQGKPALHIQILNCPGASTALVGRISEEIDKRGYSFHTASFDDASTLIPPKSHVIVLLDEKRLSYSTGERYFQTLQYLAQNTVSLVVLTSCGMVSGHNPHAAMIPGLLQALRAEGSSGKFASIDIDADGFAVDTDELEDLARSIVDQQLSLSKINEGGPGPEDREFVWQDGCLWVSRYVTDMSLRPENSPRHTVVASGDFRCSSEDAVRAVFQAPGYLPLTLETDKEMWQVIPENDIEVKIAASGLSWTQSDSLTGRSDAFHPSSEYSGVVTAVGASVIGFEAGDRVYGLGIGYIGNYSRVPASLARKMSACDDLVQMASILTVLFLSPTNEVGLAGIRIAKAKGADVWVVFDTPEQADSHVEMLGLPPSQVLSSLDLQQAGGKVLQRGFDVVLTTATQDKDLCAALKVLAPLGYLIKVGPANPGESRGAFTSELFQKNVNFSLVDPLVLLGSNPQLCNEIMDTVDGYYRDGFIEPIHAVTSIDITDLASCQIIGDVIKDMQPGKLLVTFNDANAFSKAASATPTIRFNSEASYLIAGNFDGPVRALVRWMGEHGARHIVLLSTRDISSNTEDDKLLARLATRGISLQVVQCDISDRDEILHKIPQASQERPVKGVVHLAGPNLQIPTIDNVSLSAWRQSLATKVAGTKNLHEATLDSNLDFFVLATTSPTPHGANAAGDHFLEAFARHRWHLGLPASTFSSVLVADVENETSKLGSNLHVAGTIVLSEKQFLGLIEPAFLKQNVSPPSYKQRERLGRGQDPFSTINIVTGVEPSTISPAPSDHVVSGVEAAILASPYWAEDGRLSHIVRAVSDAKRQSLSNTTRDSEEESPRAAMERLHREFDAAIAQGGLGERTQTVSFIEGAVMQAVANVLFIDVESLNPAKSVANHGVDSLVAAELRRWFNQALGVELNMVALLDPDTTIHALAESIVDMALAHKQT
ncbi:hypothetical protein BKA67DRAFT_637287 [Truncatella angustata]|uniref:Polyketide synthase n=1 Tax=Truncatella angustata TaxID=152316 RepID=A0A9P8UJD2_9PEZI|nr:uncharacterized protein BKA67DRAFT_637287 [Truncatella angustata]KAH6653120.1 hypothetical protein BKA67DRAFT_637287 [Truncatella angustata]